ncbi:MAG: hypothetical protein LC623_06910 [Halobacteriales archaeon]|nr:hypothetical protein [Halobacteriales archaeon]
MATQRARWHCVLARLGLLATSCVLLALAIPSAEALFVGGSQAVETRGPNMQEIRIQGVDFGPPIGTVCVGGHCVSPYCYGLDWKRMPYIGHYGIGVFAATGLGPGWWPAPYVGVLYPC